MAFEALGLTHELVQAVEDLEWNLPTDVQDEAIPLILGGGDVMASETGSGKTGAFALPVLQIVYEVVKGLMAPTVSKVLSSNKIYFNPQDSLRGLKIDPSGLVCDSAADKAWNGSRANAGVNSGKFYYEIKIINGLCRVGWSTENGNLNLGTCREGFGYGGTGKKSNNKKFEDYGEVFGDNDIIGCYLDKDNGIISYSKNGKDLGVAYKINMKNLLYPTICIKGGSLSANFGSSPFQYPPADKSYIGLEEGSSSQVHIIAAKKNQQKSSEDKNAKSIKLARAIIIEPTKDLAEQTYNNLVSFSKYLTNPNIEIELYVGGDRNVHPSNADIVVGTSFFIQLMIKKGFINVSSVKFLILDEADQMAGDEHGLASIRAIFASLPKGETGTARLQVCFFSATLHSPEITKLSSMICTNPIWVDLKGPDSIPDTVYHVIYKIKPENFKNCFDKSKHYITDGVHQKDRVSADSHSKESLSEAVKRAKLDALVNIITTLKIEQAIIFCRTNLDCDNLEKYLIQIGGGKGVKIGDVKGIENPFSCCVVAGWRSNEERRKNLDAFRNGEIRLLICTDVAARGIDVQGLPYVINMTLPDVIENYIHRIGRVGRQGVMGVAISIISEDNEEKVWYHSNCRNKGVNCFNTKLTEQGGCCIWYNEKSLKDQIEIRINQTIPVMADDFKLPSGVVVGGPMIIKDQYAESIKIHLAAIESNAQELQKLEILSQNSYWNLITQNHPEPCNKDMSAITDDH